MKIFAVNLILFTGLLSLTACKAGNTPPITTQNSLPILQKFATDNIRQIASDDNQLYLINAKGELWQNTQKLADNVSTAIQPIAKQGKVATANAQGFLTIWTNQQLYQSDIVLSPNSGLVWHDDCVIAIAKTPNPHPIKACILQDKLNIQQRLDIETLPDARPTIWQNKVAIFANPDNQTYRHGVLGDDMEARSLYVLKADTLADAFSPIHLENQVFEHNQVMQQNNQLATVISGAGNGAKVVIFDSETGKKIAESSPLPSNRWQSPFAFNGQWYSVQMPHIVGKLVHYQINGSRLNEKTLTESVSNHVIGSHDTQLAVRVADKVFMPNMGYRQVTMMDSAENLHTLPAFPAKLVRGVAQGQKNYWLLENGEVWRLF